MTKILSAIANKNNVANLPQLAIASHFHKKRHGKPEDQH